MSWKLMKLGSLLTQSKVPAETADANRRIRVKLNVGGVEKRPVSNEVEGATNYYIRKAGQFIFGTQNFHKGAFGVIPPELDGFETSNDIPSFDVSKDCLPEWIFFYFKVGDRYKELEKLARGVGSKRVHPKQIFELVIPVPPVARQLEIIEQVQASATRQRMIVRESGRQLSYLTQLRQALLREAMQGQLLPQDPTDEPASLLLQKLQAGRSRKNKEASLFAKEAEAVEFPFEIPKNWTWCEFGDYVTFERGKFSARPRNDPKYFGGEHKFIQIGSLDARGNIINTAPQTLNKEGLKVSKKFKKGTIVIAIVGGTIGNLGVLGVDMCFPDSIIGIQPKDGICQEFVLYTLRARQDEIKKFAYQMAGQPNIKIPTLSELLIALPPLAEQYRIVAKLEQLFQHCDALEQRVRESLNLSEQLLQTALREALAPPARAVDYGEQEEPELATAETLASTPSRRGRPRRPSSSLEAV